MKLVLVLAGLTIVLVAGRTAITLRGNRMVERPMGELATVRVPARLQARTPTSTWAGTSFLLTRPMGGFRAMGSHSPQHESLLVTQAEPRQMRRLGEHILRHLTDAFEYTDEVIWNAPLSDPVGTIRLGSGRYTPNTLDEPAWLVVALDPLRSIVVSYRVNKNESSREAAVALVRDVLASYQVNTDVAAHFASVERDLGAGVTIAFPVELTDPFPWEFDDSGVRWMVFRRHREWAEDADRPDQTIAVSTFFRPGDTSQEQAARAILEREGAVDLTRIGPPHTDGEIQVTEAVHHTGDRREPSWLATGLDPARGVGVSARVWQRDGDRKAAVGLVARAIASYRFTGDAAGFFNPK